jgi:glycosyltransferase involved in cell wall biosynthesis
MNRLRILTWHVHGSYLYYLSHIRHDIFALSKPQRCTGYVGRYGHFPWKENLHDMPVAEVRGHEFDCVLYQSRAHFELDARELLSPAQRKLPAVYLEHDPPQEHPTNTCHWAADKVDLIVHVTPFNALMWDSGSTRTRVIDHGVVVPDDVAYTGDLERGISVVNHLGKRGRRLGADVFAKVRKEIPLDLIGMGSEELGGLGEVEHRDLPRFMARYRFFFNPIRYTSMGLAVCEAMMLGIPVVGLATTEMATAVENGISGYVDTNVDTLVSRMRELLDDRQLALHLSRGARERALKRFNIERFAADWDAALKSVCSK